MPSFESQGPSILLVEDDPGDAMLVQECLAEAGFSPAATTWARTAAEAERALEQHPWCILLDLGLPDATGVAVVRAVVGRAPDVPVIVLTGRRDGTGSEALAAGAQDYIVKDDISAGVLGRSIRYAIERKRAQLTRQQLREAQLSSAEKARLERGLLPTPLLRTDRLSYSTYYQPGRDHAVLGGDFYDVVEVADGRIRAVIGDVMGHGPDEAALGVHLRVAWRALVLAGTPDPQILSHLSTLYAAESGERGGFVTACDITIDTVAETVAVRVAGHPAPLICSGGDTRYLEVRVGPPLGVELVAATGEQSATAARWPESCTPLPGGSSVVLYTDGLLDAYAVSGKDGTLGIEELVHAVLGLADSGGEAASWIEALVGSAPNDSVDDTAVVVLTTAP